MHRSFFLSIVCVAWVACSSSNPTSSLCDRLANGPGCKGTDPELCKSIAKQEIANAGSCSSALEALYACLADTEIYCSGGKAHSPGDPGVTDSETFTASGYSIEILGKICKDALDKFLDCKNCGMNAGYDGMQSGIGDPCEVTCAPGLKCLQGICTENCSITPKCDGWRYYNGQCGSLNKHVAQCRTTGRGTICLPSCDVPSDCTAFYSGTQCMDGVCAFPSCGAARTEDDACLQTTSTFANCFTCCNTKYGATARLAYIAGTKACACTAPEGCVADCSDLCSKSFVTKACVACLSAQTAKDQPCSCDFDTSCTGACTTFDACMRGCSNLP